MTVAGDKNSITVFIKQVKEFGKNQFRNESLSGITESALKIFTTLESVDIASLFALNETDFEFRLSYTTSPNEKNNTIIFFEQILNDGGITKALESGECTTYVINDDIKNKAIIIPVISPAGILGLILLSLKNYDKEFDLTTISLFSLHSNQFAYLIHSKKLEKELHSVRTQLEQKIAIRTERIKRNNRELQLILDSILTGVFIIAKNTDIIIDTNNAALKLLNVEKEEIIGTERYQWEPKEYAVCAYKDSEIENRVTEAILTDKNGKAIPVLRTISKFLLKNNEIYLESFIDISDRKKNEDEINEQKQLLNGVAESAHSLLTETNFEFSINHALKFLGKALDIDTVYIYENKYDDKLKEIYAEKIYNWSKLNNTSFTIKTKLYYNGPLKGWYDILSANKPVYGLTKDMNPELRKMQITVNLKSLLVMPIHVNNKFWGFIGFDDCTKERDWSVTEESILKAVASNIGGAIQRERTNKELILAKEEAVKADKLKSDFLAQVSHEIRTPLNSILSHSSLLQMEFEDRLTKELKGTFDNIYSGGRRIIRTIDLILNMNEIQSGMYEYNPKEFNLYDEVLMPIYKEHYCIAKEKKINLEIINEANNPIVFADFYSIDQIFNNLVNNAIKFTNEGDVKINIHNECEQLNVTVKDTGIGISEEYMGKIFNPFSQEYNGYTRKYEGNGLGLALVKQYCDLNSIAIKLESQKGLGSTFTVSFPNKKSIL
ncbi:MAG: ATP-binding protein [Ignavibacteria bacterium]|jgi:signal transduction histidine kinase/PAS domain-containing protein